MRVRYPEATTMKKVVLSARDFIEGSRARCNACPDLEQLPVNGWENRLDDHAHTNIAAGLTLAVVLFATLLGLWFRHRLPAP